MKKNKKYVTRMRWWLVWLFKSTNIFEITRELYQRIICSCDISDKEDKTMDYQIKPT
ncbi:hypothetical protein [Eudoraea adriatica]|uniref:hypothetical protein n=1 Tax=Eudoraea adriatica TaxID=446681 RepID=UPI0003A7E0DD|nr:hypothetical protein [Eudoraea adriatica]